MITGIGVDIIEIERLEKLWRRHGERMARRLFTPRELKYCLARANPAASMAARFGAKEAVMKAMNMGMGQCRWRDIEVVSGPDGSPRLCLSGFAAQKAGRLGINCWHISLAHDRTHAVAYIVAERRQAQ